MKVTESPGAYGVAQFCAAHDISRVSLYKLWRDGRGPSHFKVGARTLISREAAERWRAAMESEHARAAA